METLTTTNLTTNQAIVAGGIAGGMLATIGMIGFVLYIITIIAGWKIFVKAGEKGWKSLIPIYNIYLLYKIVGMKSWFWITLGAGILCSILFSVLGLSPSMTEAEIKAYDFSKNIPVVIIALAYCIFALFVEIKYVSRTARAFGKGTGFAVALFFFPQICWLILAFGKAKYDKKILND